MRCAFIRLTTSVVLVAASFTGSTSASATPHAARTPLHVSYRAAGPGLDAVSCSDSTSCVAIGNVYTESEALSYDGTSWSVIKSLHFTGKNPPEWNAVSCSADGACLIVGNSESRFRKSASAGWTKSTIKFPKQTHRGRGSSDYGAMSVDCASSRWCISTGQYEVAQRPKYRQYGRYALKMMMDIWNGHRWSLMKLPTSSRLHNAAATALDDQVLGRQALHGRRHV